MTLGRTQQYFTDLSAAFNILNAKRPYKQTVLGQTHGMDLLLFQPADEIPDAAHILIAAGFHGNEPAGPLAVIEYWNAVSVINLGRINISFLPLVNPSGYDQNTRRNASDLDPNRGFPHDRLPPPETPPTVEGGILIAHGAEIARLGKDGIVSLHENDDYVDQSYLFSTELDATEPGKFSLCLRDAQMTHYPNMFNGVADIDYPKIVMIKGLAFNAEPFNCFEDHMLYKYGVLRVATTETAGTDRLERRVVCNLDIIRAAERNAQHQP